MTGPQKRGAIAESMIQGIMVVLVLGAFFVVLPWALLGPVGFVGTVVVMLAVGAIWTLILAEERWS